MRRARTLSAIYVVGTFAMATAAMGSSSLNVELRGLGKSVGSTAACPDGQTTVPIIHSNRSALYCVTSARKLRKPGLDPWRIIETVRGTIPLSGGTLRTTESQQFTFTRAGTSNAIFHGRVIGGTGRYYGSTGTVSGGGKGRNGIAVWRLTFQLR